MNHAALILASGSPRRRELLSLTGLPYVVDAPEVDESCALPPEEAVQEISRRKGLAGAAAHPGCVVLSADTLVAVDGKALGKPHSEEEAFQMLSLLSGRWHQVYTGVCAVDAQGMVHQRVVGTQVHFCPMTEEEIRRYIATGEPMDKAGAYAVQGIAGLWIDKLEGSYSNVIGLPMHTVRELLDECGLHCWRAWRRMMNLIEGWYRYALQSARHWA